jgi:hypothetical protein
MTAWIAQSATEELKRGYGSLLFTGLFFIALIILFIWWLRR